MAAVVLAQRAAPQEPLAREADGGEEEETKEKLHSFGHQVRLVQRRVEHLKQPYK